jgi:hypothetical protein
MMLRFYSFEGYVRKIQNVPLKLVITALEKCLFMRTEGAYLTDPFYLFNPNV